MHVHDTFHMTRGDTSHFSQNESHAETYILGHTGYKVPIYSIKTLLLTQCERQSNAELSSTKRNG